jgi:hypothetical protein
LRLQEVGFDAFLIGEQLMQAADPGAALAELLGASANADCSGDDQAAGS